MARSISASRARRVRPVGQRVGERSADGVHDGGREHELEGLRVERIEDLLHQVVEHVAVRGTEGLDERVAVGRRAHREIGEVQAGRPALGPLVEDVDRGRIEVQREAVDEELGGLAEGEREIGGPELEQLAGRPEPGNGERGVRPSGDHELDGSRRQLGEPGQRVVGVVAPQPEGIVEDEDDLARQVPEDPGDGRRRVRVTGRRDESVDELAVVAERVAQRGADRRPEDGLVVVLSARP